MSKGWKQIGSDWYYFYPSGKMAHSGWLQDGADWFWMNSDGAMATNVWRKSDGCYYYFKSNGKMAKSEWHQDYALDNNGKWIATYHAKDNTITPDTDDSNYARSLGISSWHTKLLLVEAGQNLKLSEEQKTAVKDLQAQAAALKSEAAGFRAQMKELESNPVVAKQSLGFFESLGWHDVASYMNRSDFGAGPWDDGSGHNLAYYTKVGDVGDATSLRNMKASLEWLETYNKKYRHELENLPEQPVTSWLMLTSQMDANYTSTHRKHALAFLTGENLNWCVTDPFQFWYYYEKNLADNHLPGETGHYRNIVHKTYSATGFAINQAGPGRPIPVFSQSWNAYASEGPCAAANQRYSLAEYKKLFNDYYASYAASGYDELADQYEAKTAQAAELEAQADLIGIPYEAYESLGKYELRY